MDSKNLALLGFYPRAWSPTSLDNAGIICGHMHRVIVGLNKSFSKCHNAEASLEQA